MTVRSIEKNILKLSPAQRIHIVENVLASLYEPNPAIERAWGVESDRRLATVRSGKTKGICLEAVRKRFAK